MAVLPTLAALLAVAGGYNVDIDHPVIYTLNNNTSDTYFGFAVAFYPSSNQILVTAPKADSSERRSRRVGTVNMCPADGPARQCREIPLLTDVGTPGQVVWNNSFIGASLGVDPRGKSIAVCGPHVKFNMTYTFRTGSSVENFRSYGMCFVKDMGSAGTETITSRTVLLKQFSGGSPNRAVGNTFGLSLTGFSLSFSEDLLLLGIPGAYDLAGSLWIWRNDVRGLQERSLLNYNNPIIQVAQDSYLGYSVTSGPFYGRSQGTYYAAGAPRDYGLKGRVYLYSPDEVPQAEPTAYLSGSQTGEYYGAAVLGVDMNNDNSAELVVGAPLFSSSDYGEEGRVVVYSNSPLGLEEARQWFGMKPKARFGAALAEIGDINQDGYKDVAVGAPFEDDVGAVYIYHGRKSGIPSTYAQRISASYLTQRTGMSLRGFGLSIAGGHDVDDNSYPDLLVGAYESGAAVLMKSRPIVQLHGNITFNVAKIDIFDASCQDNGVMIPCFQVTPCVQYDGIPALKTLNLTVTVSLDPNRKFRRGFLERGKDKNATLTFRYKVVREKQKCFVSSARIPPDKKKDLVTPLQLTLTVSLDEDSFPKDRFCKYCPVLENKKITSTYLVPFQTGCNNSECVTDLRINVDIEERRDGKELIIGRDTTVTLSINVTKTGDPAYRARVNVTVPRFVDFRGNADCELVATEDEVTSTLCDVANPLVRQETLMVLLDISKLPRSATSFKVTFNATTDSKDMKPVNNIVVLQVPLVVQVDISIIGKANEEIITFVKGEVSTVYVVHTFLVRNTQPTPISAINFVLDVPKKVGGIDVTVASIKSGVQVPSKCELPDVKRQLQKSPGVAVVEDEGKSRLSRSLRSQVASRGCSNGADCTRVVCKAGPFVANRVADFTVTMSVDTSALSSEQWAGALVTNAEALIMDEWISQPPGHSPYVAVVNTTIVSVKMPQAQVAVWIIMVSIFAGIILLSLILVVLIKVGFFRRKKREAMKQLMRESITEVDEDWKMYMKNSDDDPDGFPNPTAADSDK